MGKAQLELTLPKPEGRDPEVTAAVEETKRLLEEMPGEYAWAEVSLSGAVRLLWDGVPLEELSSERLREISGD